MLTHRPIALVEAQIEEHYRLVQLSADGLDATADAIRTAIAEQQKDVQDERRRQQERLLQLDDERSKLLQAHYAHAILLDLMKREQERIAAAMKAAEVSLASTEFTAEQVGQTITNAAANKSNYHQAYSNASPTVRRQMNQALFARIEVTEDGVIEWEYTQPFALLMAAHGVSGPIVDGVSSASRHDVIDGARRNRAKAPCKKKDPSWLARVFPTLCSKEARLAEGKGFEPLVTRSATTAFEAAPFVRSGNLPATRLAVNRRLAAAEPTPQRRAAKKSVSRAAHSSLRTPCWVSNSWLRRGSVPK